MVLENNIQRNHHIRLTRTSTFGDISTVSHQQTLNPLHYLEEAKIPSVGDVIDAIIEWSKGSLGTDEFAQAKTEFQSLTGKFFTDDHFYHQRISYFLNYFLFQRPIQGCLRSNDSANTPYQHFIQSQEYSDLQLSIETRKSIENLKLHLHSVFSIRKASKTKLFVRDLNDQKKIEIQGLDYSFAGFSSGDIIQCFLFPEDNYHRFTGGVILHPKSVARLIKKSVKLNKKSECPNSFQLLFKLAKQNLFFHRYKNIEAKKIYSQEPRI